MQNRINSCDGKARLKKKYSKILKKHFLLLWMQKRVMLFIIFV